MNALTALSKFMGVYQSFRDLLKNYGLKWTVNSDDLIIARITKPQDSTELFRWVKKIKRRKPGFSDFLDFITVSGLRFSEAIESYNLIINLACQGQIDRYYISEKAVLEHFRFKHIFIRRTKKAFITFVSREIIEKIGGDQNLTRSVITKQLQRINVNLRFNDLRELWGSYMTKHLSQPEIDFLQGRTSTSVFMKNYFNPAWISDLKERVLKAEKEILKNTQG